MIQVINNKIFHLQNEKMSYIIEVLENKHLGHIYFGLKIEHFSCEDSSYYTRSDNKAAGTVKHHKENPYLSLSCIPQEYPVFGTSDYREGVLSLYQEDTPLYLDLKYQGYTIVSGKRKEKGFPSTYGDDAYTLVIDLKDEHSQILVKQYYTIFPHSMIIERHQEIINLSDNIYDIDKALSAVLDLNDANYRFVHLSGAWLKERHVKKQDISHGIVNISSLKGASSHHQNPFIALEHKDASINHGECFGMNIVYSGNFLGQVEVNEWENTRMMLGIHPEYFSWQLKPQEKFTTPEVIMGYSNQGLDGLAREYSYFIENYIIDKKWKNKLKPIVYNSWESLYYQINEENLYNLALKAKELGMECFVIDDGWFSHRRNDRSSLGDWYVNRDLFPSGIGTFGQKIHELSLQFGMWFEPEMISPDSQLIKMHPDWVAVSSIKEASIARNQYCLDFSNPEVVDYIFQQMTKIIDEAHLDYIKWDYNRNITNAYSPYLKSQGLPQGEFFHRNILGLYELYEKLFVRYPSLLIEGCAGGGGRFDLGILSYSPYIWVSDDTDAVERLKIQYGTSLAYPLSTLSNHISAKVNHQTLRQTSLSMRYHVALFGCLGYELNLETLSEKEFQIIRQQIKEYKLIRPMIFGSKFYRLLSPFENDSNIISWAIEKKDEILVGFYRILAKANDKPYEYLKLPFIKEGLYHLNNQDYVNSDMLKYIGLKLPYQFNGINEQFANLQGDFQSYIFHLKKVK